MLRPRFHPLLRLLFFVVGSAALYFLVAIVIGAALQFSRRTSPELAPLDFSQPGVALFLGALTYPPLLLWIWFCRHVFDRRNYVSLGLGITRATRNFLAGAALGALAIALVFCVLLLCGAARINGLAPEAIVAGSGYAARMLLLYGVLFFAVGYFEEVVFRGYFLQNFAAWLGKSGGIAVQAALFAAIHLLNPNGGAPVNKFFAMLNIALVGWLLALCYLKSGSLWYSIGLHAAWNFFLGCIFSLPVSGTASFRLLDVSVSENVLLTGGAFGPEGGVLPVLIFLVLIWQARRLPDHARAVSELDALRRGEVLHSWRVAPQNAAAQELPLSEEEEAAREYSPPRYKTTLGTANRRATEIDWSDVNTLGGAPSTTTFTPGTPALPAPHSDAVSAAASEPVTPNAEKTISVAPAPAGEAPREYSPATTPREFTPQSAPRENRVAPAISNPPAGIAANLSAAGEAPLPAGARVTASRSNFGNAAPPNVAQNEARVLAPDAAAVSNAAHSDVSEDSDATSANVISSAVSQSEASPRSLSAPPPMRSEWSSNETSISENEESAAPVVASEKGEFATSSVSAPPPLPVSLPAPPPMRAVAEVELPSESEAPRSRILPPPALIGASETPDAALPESASTREAAAFAPKFVASDSESSDANFASETVSQQESESESGAARAASSTALPAEQAKPKARW